MPHPAREPIEQALSLAGELVPVHAVRQALQPPESVTWLVVGRRSAGKSRLINRLLHTHAAVGLGGTTRDVVAYTDADADSDADRGLVLLDTPGIEDDLDGADLIASHLADIDGLLWVVDGLQPLTRVERRAVDRAAPPDVPLLAVLSRLDLVEPAEHSAILERVRRLLDPRAPQAVLPADDPALDSLLRTPPDPLRSPRGRLATRAALQGVATSLSHLADAIGPDPGGLAAEAVTRWRSLLADAQAHVAASVRDHQILFRDQALQALHTRLLTAAESVRAFLHAELGESPTWRPAPPDTLDLAGQARDLLGGARHVLDGLQTGAQAWQAAGEHAFEAVTQLPVSRALLQRTQALRQARHAVEQALAALPTDR